LGRIGYAETTRYCNFHCSFCSLTAEGRRYRTYDLEYIRRQLLALGPRRHVFFLDNNFYGSDRRHFCMRMELLREMRNDRHFRNWGALVTCDFSSNDDNLTMSKESGCELLFSGVESFDFGWLR